MHAIGDKPMIFLLFSSLTLTEQDLIDRKIELGPSSVPYEAVEAINTKTEGPRFSSNIS